MSKTQSKHRITITIDRDDLAAIDKARGLVNRSVWMIHHAMEAAKTKAK